MSEVGSEESGKSGEGREERGGGKARRCSHALIAHLLEIQAVVTKAG